MADPIVIPHTRIVAVSGRIASGSTTLAKRLAKTLNWRHIEGGEVFWEAIRKEKGLEAKDTNLRNDSDDMIFDKELKRILKEEKDIVLETKLAGFNAQGIDGIFKILVICEDISGVDQVQIRIDRLVNREGLTLEAAKEEIIEREQNDLLKWRKLYAKDDQDWFYFDKTYYDLVINTYSHNQDEALSLALAALHIPLSA